MPASDTPKSHTVKAFDEELKALNHMVARMGGRAENQLNSAIAALVQRNAELASQVVESDHEIDLAEQQIAEHAVRTLALRQPMATDLRDIIGALKISTDLERIGDYAANVAKRAIALSQMPAIRQSGAIQRMGRLVQQLMKNVLDAFIERDIAVARQVWSGDAEVDEMYNSLFRELLTYMMEDPRNISACTHMLFIAKNIERIGDHTTNVAETIHFMVSGSYLIDARPKSDSASFAVISRDDDAATASEQPE
ncbi:MAG: phosphate signaling complex protein PhoU [Alphaproteobacteria bacterium]